MRFHVLALPHTQTTAAFSTCAYTNKVVGFCRMMKDRGHEVFLYAGEQNEAPCDELITCISEEERAAAVGDRPYVEASFDHTLPHWRHFNHRAAVQIRKRAQPQDFVCVIAGHAQKPVADALPGMMVVEFGVGYGGVFSKYRVFESYAWMHMHYGAATGGDPTKADGQWYDAVIPGYLDPAMFPVKGEEFRGPDCVPREVEMTMDHLNVRGHVGPRGDGTFHQEDQDREMKTRRRHVEMHNLMREPYYLFVGRLINRKGYSIAQQVCEKLGKRLIVAGPGKLEGYGEHVGTVGPEERGRLMAGATALFAPTLYVEPFGNVAIEAMACGTPVIATDWGAFTETVIDGVTGFRCRTFAEFTEAAQRAPSLDSATIRRLTVDRYSLDVIGKKYETYFERLADLWGDGWYAAA